MKKNFARIALAGLLSAVVAFGTAACAPSNIATDGSNLSTSLDPVPLAEPTEITLSLASYIEQSAHVMLALREGEFEKENLIVNLEILPQTEAIPALAQGQVDVSFAGISASFFNAVAGGANIKMVFPGATKRSGDGLYVRNDLVAGAPASLKGKKIGTSAGWSLVQATLISRYLATAGLTLNDVESVTLPLPDLPAALIAGQVDAVWSSSPVNAPLIEQNAATKVTEYGPDEYGSAVVFGPNLLEDHPEIGQAFIRALTRTIVNNLQGDYKTNPETVAKLAAALEVTEEEILMTDSVTYGFEFNDAIFTESQNLWISLGDVVSYDTPLDPSQTVDSSFLTRINLD